MAPCAVKCRSTEPTMSSTDRITPPRGPGPRPHLAEAPFGCREFFLYDDTATLRECDTFIIPNGYGVLAYAHELGNVLSALNRRVCAVNVAGQGRSEGSLSIAAGSRDLVWYLDQVDEHSVSLLVHCSAMLALLQIPPTDGFWRRIDRVVLYAYLANPILHLERFHQKARRFGVHVDSHPEDLSAFGPPKYATIPVPFAVIHPRDRLNQLRATDEDVEALLCAAHPFRFVRPDTGYDIDDEPQHRRIADTVAQIIQPLLTTEF